MLNFNGNTPPVGPTYSGIVGLNRGTTGSSIPQSAFRRWASSQGTSNPTVASTPAPTYNGSPVVDTPKLTNTLTGTGSSISEEPKEFDPTGSQSTGTQYDEVRDQLQDNATDPTLSQGSTQEAVNITEKEGEIVGTEGLQMKPIEPVSAATTEAIQVAATGAQDVGANPAVAAGRTASAGYTAAQTELSTIKGIMEAELAQTGSISPATAASYSAAEASFTQVASTTKGYVSQLAEGSTAVAVSAEAAYQELDKVDPRTMATALTHKLPNEATVQGQLDGLLSSLETGEIPVWARPAVDAANAQMAARGMSSSSVGRNALFNSIINSALPIAQADAASSLAIFQQDVSNEQQAVLANSQFFQTLTVKNLDNAQQTALLNASNASNANIANAQNMTQASIQNANNFLQMDLANMSNEQQTNAINAQMRQQTLLSNQAAKNTALQFNAANEQQAEQFNANLAAQVAQFNTQQANNMSQFNTSEANSAAKLEAQLDQTAALANAQAANRAGEFNATQKNAIAQFNSQQAFARDQFNVQNATAISQSNATWRRQMNQVNTASQNAVNQANAMNKFNLSNQALTFLWQEQRDAASWANSNTQNSEERKTRLAIAALGSDSAKDAATLQSITQLAGAAVDLYSNWD